MGGPVAIDLESVSKKYCRSLKRSMLYGMTDIMRNVCGMGSRPERLRKHEFFALSDVSLSVERGEIVGIIGPNGSGKTTLLKLINGIFWPDTGTITIRGRVGALIEVGAGFHPLLSGRENVYVNASILGMNRSEVNERFDSIVDFADVGSFIDTPVKFFSSGMFVRLGFSVAVHCRPDILLIDEVLAVGDASFRRKATERMQEIRADGTTILFVSHDLNRVEAFCDSGLYLQRGRIEASGRIGPVVAAYQNALLDPEVLEQTDQVFRDVLQRERMISETYNSGELEVTGLRIVDSEGRDQTEFSSGETLRIVCDVDPKDPIDDWLMSLMIRRSDGVQCIVERSLHHGVEHPPLDRPTTITATLEQLQLTAGTYVIHVAFSDRGLVQPVGRRGGRDIFTVRDPVPNPEYREGVYHPQVRWDITR